MTLPRQALLLSLASVALLVSGCAESPNDLAPSRDDAPAVDVEVEPDRIADVPHVHDYWKGAERVTLLDQEIVIDPADAAEWLFGSTFFAHDPQLGGTFVDLPANATVYEGTGRLDLTATWTDPTITGLKFVYRHAGSGEVDFTWKSLASGSPHSIDVSPDMTDMPHAKTSRWLFVLGADGPARTAVGSVHLRIDITKMRDLSEFPPHPDLWQGANESLILDAEGVARTTIVPHGFLQGLTDPLAPPADRLDATRLVPMETTRLEVTVEVREVRPDAELVGMRLHYHAPDRPNFDREEADEPTRSTDGATWTWNIPVAMQQTDNPYAEASDWWFALRPQYAHPVPGGPACGEGCHEGEVAFTMRVLALRGDEAAQPEAQTATR